LKTAYPYNERTHNLEAATAISHRDCNSVTPVQCNPVFGVTFGNALFLAVGKGGTIRTSADGITWTRQNSTVTADLYSACWSPHKSVFVVCGNHGTLLTSPDGVTWNKQSCAAGADALSAIVWSEEIKLFVAVSGTNRLLVSADAATWNLQKVGSRTVRGVYWCRYLGRFVYL